MTDAPDPDNGRSPGAGPGGLQAVSADTMSEGPTSSGSRPVALCAFGAALLLCACQQTGPAAPLAQAPVPAIAAIQGVSPRGAPVAVVALDGGPNDTAQRFGLYLSEAAQASNVVTVSPGRASYLLRGYLTAAIDGEAVRLTAVSDLFDHRKTRRQRITDEIVVPRRGPDPWSAMDEATLAALATRSAQSLAAVLTTTVEAQAAGKGSSTSAPAADAAASGTTIVARQVASPRPAPAVRAADAR